MSIKIEVMTYSEDNEISDEYLPIPEGTTHIVHIDLISRDNATVSRQRFLPGRYGERGFYFSDKTKVRIIKAMNNAFPDADKVLLLVRQVVALNIEYLDVPKHDS